MKAKHLFTALLGTSLILTSSLVNFKAVQAAQERSRNNPRAPACTPGVRSSYIFFNDNNCLEISGSIFATAHFGNPIFGRLIPRRFIPADPAIYSSGRGDFAIQSHSLTPRGVINTDLLLRMDWIADLPAGVPFPVPYMRYAGINWQPTEQQSVKFGYLDSLFYSWISYGGIFNNDVLFGVPGTTPALSYSYTDDDRKLAYAISIEQQSPRYVSSLGLNFYAVPGYLIAGATEPTDNLVANTSTFGLTDREEYDKQALPNLSLAVRGSSGPVTLSNVTSLNLSNLNVATRINANLEVNDSLMLWLQGGYKSRNDSYIYVDEDGVPTARTDESNEQNLYLKRLGYDAYGAWGGHFYGYAGMSYKWTESLTLHAQAGADSSRNLLAGLNATYQIYKNVLLLGEVNYTVNRDDTSARAQKNGHVPIVLYKNEERLGFFVQLKVLF